MFSDDEINDFKNFQQRLAEKGFEVLMIGGFCPFQIEANHKSGISVYMRSRHQTASLEVYDCQMESGLNVVLPDDKHIIWEGEFDCFEEFEAGYISANQADYAFSQLWADALERIDR